RRFDGTIYADFARARLEELKKGQQAAVAPPVVPAPPADTTPKPAVGVFDGNWVITRRGTRCGGPTQAIEITIKNGVARGHAGAGRLSGAVAGDGAIRFSHPPSLGPATSMDYSGVLGGNSGRGSFAARGGPCTGTFIAKRS